jgi:exopolysaccharide biosynthesis polyprenyl glycosylphosphotransferase
MTTDVHPTALPIARAGSTPSPSRVETKRSPEARLTRRYLTGLRLTDAAAIALAMGTSFAIGYWLNFHGPMGRELAVCVAIGTVWYLALFLVGSHGRRTLHSSTAEYKHVLNTSIGVFGILGVVDILLAIHLGREFAAALPVGLLLLVAGRWSWRTWLAGMPVDKRYLQRALVVGSAQDVRYVLRQIRLAGAGYNVVGAAVTDTGVDLVSEGTSRVPVVCEPGTVAQAAVDFDADAVIVASQPHDEGEFVRNLSWSLERSGADLVLASRLVDVAGPRVHFSPVQGLPLIHVEIPRFEGGKHTLKRLVDALLAGAALLALSPLLLAAAIAIRLDDGGPVLFRQTRVGKDGSTFRMIKFRSMVTDAEARLATLRELADDGNGMLFKLRDDPRVTRIGRVLRRYSIDELPQLWNVLVGDMSLVGPRPPLPSEVAEYADHVRRRLYIKPGLTGMWQISGRSDLSWDESVRIDLFYVENWSLMGDLVILWRTVRVLLRPVGAY